MLAICFYVNYLCMFALDFQKEKEYAEEFGNSGITREGKDH